MSVGSTELTTSGGAGFAGAGAGTCVVLKVGGASTGGVAEAVAAIEGPVCVVHGAGPQISEKMAKRGLTPEFVNGRRVTTGAVLEIVCESFAAVNAAVCASIGPRAVPLSGDEIGLGALHVAELGHVGDPIPSAPVAVLDALDAGFVPVVSPLARGPLNVNADEMASALAVGIGARLIRFLTDVPGVYRDGQLIPSIDAGRVETLVERGVFDGGIVPKLLAAALAARNGIAAEIGSTAVVA
jgi:acetylglutamate kinase